MSAGITDSDTMFSVRGTPWRGLGAVLDRPPATVGEAIEASGLGWSVAKRRLAIDCGADLPDVLRYRGFTGHYATVRQDNDEVLGVVGERYRIVQNHEAFAFVDQLLGSLIHFETAGSLHGGRRVWVLATLPDHVDAGGDDVRPYVLLMNSHDGSTAVVAATTPIRVVCQNTLNWGLANARRKFFDPPHRSGYAARPRGSPSPRSVHQLLRAVQALRRPARLRALHRTPAPRRPRQALPKRHERLREQPHTQLAPADEGPHRTVPG
jgi:phage/plasmid-like protein (TIGR03299 family)